MANRNDTYVVVTKGGLAFLPVPTVLVLISQTHTHTGQEMAGIFTGTDYLEKIILPGRKSKSEPSHLFSVEAVLRIDLI